jgi:hypothetical protein
MHLLGVLKILSVSVCVYGHKYMSEQIPNGDRVPHPCGQGYIWEGVGHHYPGGAKGTGGIRNRFGIDFKLAGLVCRYRQFTDLYRIQRLSVETIHTFILYCLLKINLLLFNVLY